MGDDQTYAPAMADLTITGEISKIDDDKRQVFGWASITEMDGKPVVDLQNDVIETYELEKAAYDYVLHSRVGGEMHQRVKKAKDAPKQVGTLIESMVLTPEKIEKMGLPPETPRGWWIGFKVEDEEVWKAVKDKKYAGFSIHGKGLRKEAPLDEINKGVFTRSPEEYQGWLKRISRAAGVSTEEIDDSLKAWMREEGLANPSDDDIHEFLMEAYGEGDKSQAEVDDQFAKFFAAEPEKVKKMDQKVEFLVTKAAEMAKDETEFAANLAEIGKALAPHDADAAVYVMEVRKHLIGRHEQKDHDPKKKGGHKRSQHGTKKDPGMLSDTQRRQRITPLAAILNPVQTVGAMQGTTAVFRNNWGRKLPFMDNRQVFASDAMAGAARGTLQGGPIGTALGYGLGSMSEKRRVARGQGRVKTFGTHNRDGSRKPLVRKMFSDREREVLAKYLGPDALEPVEKRIEERNGQYVVLSESGKVLGKHDTREKAQRQLAAVEANKED